MSITVPVPTTSIVDENGMMNTNIMVWTQRITRAVNDLEVLEGSGNPEGVVTAKPNRSYTDTDTQIAYVKQSGTGNTGWILV